MIIPALLPDNPAEVEAIYQRLSDLTGVPIDQEGPPAAPCVQGRGILQLVLEGETNRPYDSWPIACDIDETIARILREEQIDLPGVSIEVVPVRDYTTGSLTTAIIGYLGPIPAAYKEYYEDLGFIAGRDKIGYIGIEGWYQDVLAGDNGQKVVERDVAGKQLREVGIVTQPVPGNSLRLTIDTRLQTAAETALRNRMEFINRYAEDSGKRLAAIYSSETERFIESRFQWGTCHQPFLPHLKITYQTGKIRRLIVLRQWYYLNCHLVGGNSTGDCTAKK